MNALDAWFTQANADGATIDRLRQQVETLRRALESAPIDLIGHSEFCRLGADHARCVCWLGHRKAALAAVPI